MREYKLIFAGSMGAGKTTAIEKLSEIDVVNTDVANTDKGAHLKALTTVGIDYGQIVIPPDIKLGLYGVPGQERFNFLWSIVSQGSLGAVILVDATSVESLGFAESHIDFFAEKGLENLIIGVTHTDVEGACSIDDFYAIAEKRSYPFPVFTVDARKKEDILLLIETILACAEAEEIGV